MLGFKLIHVNKRGPWVISRMPHLYSNGFRRAKVITIVLTLTTPVTYEPQQIMPIKLLILELYSIRTYVANDFALSHDND